MFQLMKKFVCLAGMVLFVLPSVLSAASQPAAGTDVLAEMITFDESYDAGKWQEASVSVEKMEKLISEIFVQAQLDDYILEEHLDELKKNVAENNVSGTEDAYLAFQKQYMNFISHFDHDVHPILSRIEYYVFTGAQEALAKKEYVVFQRDVKMAGILVEHGKVVLMNKGISEQELNKFNAKVRALGLTVKKGNYQQSEELFAQLKAEYTSFMERYKKK